MIFSSNIFLFAFLPCVLFGYYVIFQKSRTAQNRFLLATSLLFYAWGGVGPFFLMIGSILLNWFAADRIAKSSTDRAKQCLLAVAVTVNLLLLFLFKYLCFALENINWLFRSQILVPVIELPIGISFFTFQAMSYVIDVYRKKGTALKNPLDVGLYISLFPQLIAGPIVRYDTVADQIFNRKETADKFSEGVYRFVYGLAKKVLLANNISVVATAAFSAQEPSTLLAWLGAVAYTLQIYFDFSGYSDMAIGLGKMFGFDFLENFDYPYISKSVTEFWRRWHISMGTWFRDYVYFPLGGSRVDKKWKVYRNLFVVWLLTGIWHGANWTFVLWGLLQFAVIALEKTFAKGSGQKGTVSKILGWGYTLFFVMLGWVLFNSADVGSAITYIEAMFGKNALWDAQTLLLWREHWVVFLLGIIISTPVFAKLRKLADRLTNNIYILEGVLVVVLFVLVFAYVARGAVSPFIYFNF